ncbi:hypothetical protein [uncultured Proteiniphilum sp.]|uniref:hypothetical protein n=1 Tax=uncultured Proteiniphilum sp. TaxID=497637 RepID=UPI002627E2DA|nr:hypothetical protein [uncultured Proteiniphilum sp.]
MKKITSIIAFLLPALYMAASPLLPADTTFHYNNRKVVISENDNELNISVYHRNEQGDTVQNHKIYEGIFTEERSIERRYENSFEISIPDIFKPKKDRRASRAHWAGFGVGFANLPEGFDSDGELASVLNLNRSLQYNLNLIESSWRMGNSNFTGIVGAGIQFNAIHLQSNKAIEVEDYRTVITTTIPGDEYRKSRLHYTYLTFPFLIETNWNIGRGSHFFINAGVVGKVKTASSSKIWWNDENGKKQKTKLPGELNIRPVTLDLLAQGGVNDFGFFISYTPFDLFRDNKGPKANQATLGLQLYF